MSDTDTDEEVMKIKRRRAGEASSPSPVKGSGGQLKAASTPVNEFAKNVEKDPLTGRTIVKVIKFEPFDPAREYKAVVQKTGRYTGKWLSRFITYVDRTLAYGMAEGQPAKRSLIVSSVARGAEKGNDPLSIIVEGTGNDNKPATFIFKLESADLHELWWLRIAQSLDHYQLAEMPRAGFPLFNPKTGIPFVDVPLDLLQVFAPLDRLTLHHFSRATVRHCIEGKFVDRANVVFAGDLCLYVCEMDANMRRCIPMKDIHRLMTVAPTGDEKLLTVGVQCELPECDLFFRIDPAEGDRLVKVLCTLHYHHGGAKGSRLKREQLATVEMLKALLSLQPNEFFKLKIALPMSKKFMLKLVADGEQGKHLISVPVVRSLVSATSTTNPPPVTTVAEASSDTKKVPTKRRLSISSDEGSDTKKDDRVANPLGGTKSEAPTENRNRRNITDSDVDDDFPVKPSFSGASPLAAFSTAQRNEAPSGFVSSSTGPINVAPGIDKMHRLLNHVKLPQYYSILTERGVDWDVFSCMDSLDLKQKGVTSVDHQIAIENALNDPKLMQALQQNDGLPPSRPDDSAPPPPPPPPPPTGAPAFIDDDDL